MATVFSDQLFTQSTLKTSSGLFITVVLNPSASRLTNDLLRLDSKGFLSGYMVNPDKIPSWLVPGTVLKGNVNGLEMVLTFEPSPQSFITLVSEIIGDRVNFSYVSTSEMINP